MVYSQALADRAAAWLALPLTDKRSPDGLLELATIWAATQGQPLPECLRQCQYSERARAVAAYLREFSLFSSSADMDTQTTNTYQFKPEYAGQTLTADDYGKAVTADTLTDEDAEHFIKKGFGHVFQKIGAAIEAVGEKLEGVGDGLAQDEDDDQPTEREQELQAEVDEAKQKLADQTTSYNAAYGQVTAALDSEKQAHEATKGQLSEVQRQLATAQKQLADATAPKAKKPAAAPATPVAPAMTASTTPAPTSDATTSDTDGTTSNGSSATA